MRRDVIENPIEFGIIKRAVAVRPHHLAAEAEAAIDRAGMERLDEHAIRVAMHEALDGRMRMIADRVGAFRRHGREFARIGQELCGDAGCPPSDERGNRRGDRDGVACSNSLEFRRRAGIQQRGCFQIADAAQGLHAPSRKGNGVKITSCTLSTPAASIASRSKPRAAPEAGGIWARAARKSSSSG